MNGPGRSPPLSETQIQNLRKIANDCAEKRLYTSAIFFSDKLVTLTGGKLEDVHLLANAYFLSKQYKRCITLLDKSTAVKEEPRTKLLMAQCLLETKQYDECLDLLGEDQEHQMDVARCATSPRDSQTLNVRLMEVLAGLCLMRGRAFEAQENRTESRKWFERALRTDPHCYEALEVLIDNYMLPAAEEQNLVQELQFESGEEWLRHIYSLKTQKYAQHELVLPAVIATANMDVLISRAENAFYRNEFSKCLELTSRVLNEDPHNNSSRLIALHISSLLELGMKNQLFYFAHKLVNENPEMAVAWYAVGCYYFLVGKNEQARRHFSKSTSLQAQFGPSWIGFGHAFAADSEHDQAMAAYRTAERMLKGCHLPNLYIGMELIRVNNFTHALSCLKTAQEICDYDPMIYNELGVIAYKNKDFTKAVAYFQRALEMIGTNISPAWESTLLNLGHAYRKLQRYEEAIVQYERAEGLTGKNGATVAALAFTYHLMGAIDKAIDFYHRALALKPDDTFSNEMLGRALEEAMNKI